MKYTIKSPFFFRRCPWLMASKSSIFRGVFEAKPQPWDWLPSSVSTAGGRSIEEFFCGKMCFPKNMGRITKKVVILPYFNIFYHSPEKEGGRFSPNLLRFHQHESFERLQAWETIDTKHLFVSCNKNVQGANTSHLGWRADGWVNAPISRWTQKFLGRFNP